MSVFNYKTGFLKWIMLGSLIVSGMFVLPDLYASQVNAVFADEEDAICGIWFTNNNNSKVEIYRKNGMYFGKIIWIKNPSKGNYTNTVVIFDMAYNQTRRVWDRGTLYYPVKDTQYQGIIELFNKDTLSIRAFVGKPMFGKTLTWTRVK